MIDEIIRLYGQDMKKEMLSKYKTFASYPKSIKAKNYFFKQSTENVFSTLSSFGRTKLVIRLNPKFMKLAIKTYANPFFSEVDIIYVFPFVIVFTAIQIKSLVFPSAILLWKKRFLLIA